MTRDLVELLGYVALIALCGLLVWSCYDRRCRGHGPGWGASHYHEGMCVGPNGELRAMP